MSKYVVALECLADDVPAGSVGVVEYVSFNVVQVAFATCTIETHASLFAYVRNGRRTIKAKRKLMQRPMRSAALWRADTMSALERTAFHREHVAELNAMHHTWPDTDIVKAKRDTIANHHVAKNNARFCRKSAAREGFYLP